MFERFTRAAREVVLTAQEEARALAADRVGEEHLLLAVVVRSSPLLFELPGGGSAGEPHRVDALRVRELVAGDADAAALAALGISLAEVRRRAVEQFGRDAWARTCGGRIAFSPGAKGALEAALREALELRCRRIGAEHVLLGLLRDESGPAGELLRRLDVDPLELRTRLRAALASAGRVATR